MKISYLWISDYIDVPAKPDDLRDSLSAVGLVVEAMQQVGDDTVLDLEIPSNRPDCLSHIGIARELAAIYDCDLKIPAPNNPQGSGSFPIAIQDQDLCSRYCGQVIRGVKIGESPAWMKKRLEAVGQRPINNIVDVTNYVLMEIGHPLHAFDLAKIQGPEIIVRRARPGEKLRTLDGVERELDSENLVIADARVPVALAGVMGGEQSEISASSSDLLIESAYFDPVFIGRTARRFQMRTEASHRFERGADLQATAPALERCVGLILKLAGGRVGTPVIDVFPNPRPLPVVPMRRQRMKLYTVTDVPENFVRATFRRLGFQAEETAEGWRVTAPSHRGDISVEEDLIEEVLRHHGYDKIPSALPAWKGKGEFLQETERRSLLAELFRALGYSETLNWSLMDPDLQSLLGYEESPVLLKNPLSADASQLRTHLLPNLVLAARHNQNRGQESIRLFEIGKAFVQQAGSVVEKEHLAWVAMGAESRKYWSHQEDLLNYFYMKGVLESLVRGTGLNRPELRPAMARFLNPAQSAEIYKDGKRIGCLGSLHPELLEALKLRNALFFGEFNLSELGQAASARVSYKPISPFPFVFRDFSFLADRKVPFGNLMHFILRHSVANLRNVELIDLYDSEQLPPGKISLAIRFFFENPERTLTDEEVQQAHDRIVQGIQREFGVIPR